MHKPALTNKIKHIPVEQKPIEKREGLQKKASVNINALKNGSEITKKSLPFYF